MQKLRPLEPPRRPAAAVPPRHRPAGQKKTGSQPNKAEVAGPQSCADSRTLPPRQWHVSSERFLWRQLRQHQTALELCRSEGCSRSVTTPIEESISEAWALLRLSGVR